MASDTAVMQGRDQQGPLRSSFADDPELAEPLDAFVVGLAERIDRLQDADAHAEFAVLGQLARELAADARAVGHGPVAEVALRVSSAAEEGKAEDAHAELVSLTELAQRVRMGHRGAM